MSNLYRGPSIDASYQVSVHLAEGFQRRRLKCEKLTDDRRRTPSDGKGELKNNKEKTIKNKPLTTTWLLLRSCYKLNLRSKWREILTSHYILYLIHIYPILLSSLVRLEKVYCDIYSESCLILTLNKLESYINQTLNKVPLEEIFVKLEHLSVQNTKVGPKEDGFKTDFTILQ